MLNPQEFLVSSKLGLSSMIGNTINHVQCPLTKGNKSSCQWAKRDGSVRDFPEVGLIECSNCGLVAHEVDLRQKIDYESGTMHSWASGYGQNLESPSEDISRRVEAIGKLAQIYKIERILDFGSGRGEVLSALNGKYQAKGLEPEQEARIKCERAGFEVASSTAAYKEKAETFDLITLFHVVEHFYESHEEFSNIVELLAPGGIIVIETPISQDALLTNYNSEQFSNFTYWSHHPVLHSFDSLRGLLTNAGLEVIQEIGIQRYGLANHLYWLAKGMPGGHVIWDDLISSKTESDYQEDLASKGTSDTLWIVAQRPQVT